MNANYELICIEGKHKFKHHIIAEEVLGRKLKDMEMVHHVDGNPKNNNRDNLVICSRPYHNFLHARMKAQKGCGNPNYKRCQFCGEWDDPKNMYVKPHHWEAYHRSCNNKQLAERKAKLKTSNDNVTEKQFKDLGHFELVS